VYASGRGKGPEGTLFIYDHCGEYTLSKKPRRLVYAICPHARDLHLLPPVHYSHTHKHTHTPFNGHLSGTTRVSRYQKGKTNLDFTEARDSEWQWHQQGRMQVCTSLQTNNHARQHPTSQFLQACRPTNSVKAPKATFCCTNTNTNCLFCTAVVTYLENLQVHCDDNHSAPDREAQ